MSVLNNKEDYDKVMQYCEAVNKNIESLKPDFITTANYILDNYDKNTLVNITLPKAPDDIQALSDKDFGSLGWFSNLGYPVPQEVDINLGEEFVVKTFYHLVDGYTPDSNFSYPYYFYYMAISARTVSDEELYLKSLNKVIEITEDDSYNEYRIKAQEAIENTKS